MVGLRLGREPQRLLPTARAMESENEAQRPHGECGSMSSQILGSRTHQGSRGRWGMRLVAKDAVGVTVRARRLLF